MQEPVRSALPRIGNGSTGGGRRDQAARGRARAAPHGQASAPSRPRADSSPAAAGDAAPGRKRGRKQRPTCVRRSPEDTCSRRYAKRSSELLPAPPAAGRPRALRQARAGAPIPGAGPRPAQRLTKRAGERRRSAQPRKGGSPEGGRRRAPRGPNPRGAARRPRWLRSVPLFPPGEDAALPETAAPAYLSATPQPPPSSQPPARPARSTRQRAPSTQQPAARREAPAPTGTSRLRPRPAVTLPPAPANGARAAEPLTSRGAGRRLRRTKARPRPARPSPRTCGPPGAAAAAPRGSPRTVPAVRSGWVSRTGRKRQRGDERPVPRPGWGGGVEAAAPPGVQTNGGGESGR